MTEKQIDPYKLNEVLEQILDGIHILQQREASASPEFQILMSNYLNKANEGERNLARFEEAQERLNIKEQECKHLIIGLEDARSKIANFENDFRGLKGDYEREISKLRDEIAKLKLEKDTLSIDLKKEFEENLSESMLNLQKQANLYKEQFTESQEEKQRLENKLSEKTHEFNTLEKEMKDLKTKLVSEQSMLRDEILEASKRSSQIEQQFHQEHENMIRRLRELEILTEDLTNALNLKQRELEYKDALLSQAFKPSNPRYEGQNYAPVSPPPPPPYKTAEIPKQTPPPQQQQPVSENEPSQSGHVGGIWSKLSPVI